MATEIIAKTIPAKTIPTHITPKFNVAGSLICKGNVLNKIIYLCLNLFVLSLMIFLLYQHHQHYTFFLYLVI